MGPLRLAVTAVSLGLWACATGTPQVRAEEPLYFAVEVRRDGVRLAAPKLLGFEGHRVVAERLAGVAPVYRLALRPEDAGDGYQVRWPLELPSGRAGGRVSLLHGEERTVRLDASTELTLLLLRVDSPEFRALVRQPEARREL